MIVPHIIYFSHPLHCASIDQSAFNDDVSAVPTNSGRLFLHIFGLQVVALGGKLEPYFFHLRNVLYFVFFLFFFRVEQIPQSTEGKYWFHYVDRTVTMEILEQLTNEFLIIYENSPSRLKKQLSTCKGLSLNAKSVNIYICIYIYSVYA